MEASLILDGLAVVVLFILPYHAKRVFLSYDKKLFRCRRCGNCCRNSVIPLTKKDVERIRKAGYGGFYADTWIGKKIMLTGKGGCVFYREGICNIYDIRPEICRKFPFNELLGVIPYARTWTQCPSMQEMKRLIE